METVFMGTTTSDQEMVAGGKCFSFGPDTAVMIGFWGAAGGDVEGG